MPYKDPEKRREHHRLYMQGWYRRNKAVHIGRVGQRRKRMRERFQELKRTLSCNRCVENHPACLQFHHRDSSRKEFTISTIRGGDVSAERVLAEMEKCEVVCANCHLKIHWDIRLHKNQKQTPSEARDHRPASVPGARIELAAKGL